MCVSPWTLLNVEGLEAQVTSLTHLYTIVIVYINIILHHQHVRQHLLLLVLILLESKGQSQKK